MGKQVKLLSATLELNAKQSVCKSFQFAGLGTKISPHILWYQGYGQASAGCSGLVLWLGQFSLLHKLS